MMRSRCLMMLAALALVGAAPHPALPASGGGYDLRGLATPARQSPLAGGGFGLSGTIPARILPQGGSYLLTPQTANCETGQASAACRCLCAQVLFADDFESGDTSAWSAP